MANIFKMIIGAKEDKAAWHRLQARAEALPPDYRFVYKKMQGYMMNFAGGDGMEVVELCKSIAELLEEGAADGKNVRDVIGNNPAEFCDELMKDAETWTGKLRISLNDSIAKRLNS